MKHESTFTSLDLGPHKNGRITDMDIGPDGYLYILSAENKEAIVHKIKENKFSLSD